MIDMDLLLAAVVLVVMALGLLRQRALRVRWVVSASVLVLALLPWPYGLAHWLLGYVAGFSCSSGLLALAMGVALLGGPALPMRQWRIVFGVVVLTALWFYPMSLGITPWDPYGAGFGSRWLVAGLLLAGLVAWWLDAWLLVVLLVAGQVAWRLGLLSSDNLWDYLLDPWLLGWALGWWVMQHRRQRRAAKARPQSTSQDVLSG